jgi:hypothetical protein
MATGSSGSAWAGAEQVGTTGLRTEVVDKILKQVAARKYKFKQAVTISSSNAWKNSFFRASTDILAGESGNATKGIPRGANFPQAVTEFEKIDAWIEKYGLEDFIHYEDIITNDVDVQRRTLIKLTEGVVKAVDDEIWAVLTESQTPSAIQSVTITGNQCWDVASAAIIDDLMHAKQLIGVANYDTSNLMCFISEKDHRSIVKWLSDKGAQFPSVGEDMANNGRVGKLAGINLVVSNSVTASYALVVVPKTCGTWKEAVPLQSDLKTEAFKGTRVRVCEMGVTQLTDPKACCLIVNTQE